MRTENLLFLTIYLNVPCQDQHELFTLFIRVEAGFAPGVKMDQQKSERTTED